MRLTKHTDYSLRVLVYLGVRPGRVATIEEVADAYTISRNHLMKVVHRLATHGIVETQRGRHGGFRLARDPSAIGLGAVVRITEPDFAVVECMDPHGDGCVIYGSCALRGALHDATNAWFAVLDRYTLADLVERQTELAELLQISG
ncbi:MAG TPA: Rrf2 family transcriptional regulator [Bryobacteraceae bacterium]|nr:Rrf2 family transcriptional regulator [Bryobacteraceae bacterium]